MDSKKGERRKQIKELKGNIINIRKAGNGELRKRIRLID